MKPPASKTLASSFSRAFQGIVFAIRTERNMRIHLLAAILAITGGLYYKLAPWKWALMLLAIGLVLAAELVNTAIEKVVDLHSPTYHPVAKRAKDTAAGAVLMAAVTAIAIAVVIFFF